MRLRAASGALRRRLSAARASFRRHEKRGIMNKSLENRHHTRRACISSFRTPRSGTCNRRATCHGPTTKHINVERSRPSKYVSNLNRSIRSGSGTRSWWGEIKGELHVHFPPDSRPRQMPDRHARAASCCVENRPPAHRAPPRRIVFVVPRAGDADEVQIFFLMKCDVENQSAALIAGEAVPAGRLQGQSCADQGRVAGTEAWWTTNR